MKAFSFLLVLSWLSISLFAQEDVLRYPLPTGGQPFDYNYSKASKVHCKKYNYFEILDEWDKYYDYSKDSLNLTIRAPWGIQYIKYNLDGTMASFSSPVNKWNDIYTYTDDGKILKIENKANKDKVISYSMYSYNNSTLTITFYHYSEIYDKFFVSGKSVFERNKDYIKQIDHLYYIETGEWEVSEIYDIYKLDTYGRMIETGWYDKKGKYNLNSQYSYTNNGYIVYSKFNNRNYAIREYTFDDRGDLIKEIWYNWNENGSKNLSSITDYTYTYPNPTSNEKIKQQDYKVYSIKNRLIIENYIGDNNVKASIYLITGQLLKIVSISNNRTEIPLASGFYVVVMNNQSYKVRIK